MSFLSPGIELPFTNGFYEDTSLQFSAQRCINYRPRIALSPALSPETLVLSEGIEDLITGLDGISRGSLEVNEIPYIVCGVRLYRLNRTVNPDLTETFSTTDLGEITGTGPVIMEESRSATGYELVIVVPGDTAYSLETSTDTLTTLNGLSNFLSPVDDVVNVLGFWVFLQTDTDIIFHSNLRDSLIYNALDFELVVDTSKGTGLVKHRGELYVFGDNELIPYAFTGGSNFVFSRRPSAVLDKGLRTVTAKVTMSQRVIFMGQAKDEQPKIYSYQSGYPRRISTDTIEKVFEEKTDDEINNSVMFTASRNGADLVYLIFGDECFVYDLVTNKWHERRSLINDNDRRWRANTIVKAYNQFFVGDFQDGRVGKLNDSTEEYGISIHRSFVVQPFDNRGKFIQVRGVRLIMDVGFNGSMSLDWSDDGGYTFGNDLILDAGDIGDYGRLLEWDRLGTAPFSRVLRFGTSTNAQCNVNKLLALA